MTNAPKDWDCQVAGRGNRPMTCSSVQPSARGNVTGRAAQAAPAQAWRSNQTTPWAVANRKATVERPRHPPRGDKHLGDRDREPGRKNPDGRERPLPQEQRDDDQSNQHRGVRHEELPGADESAEPTDAGWLESSPFGTTGDRRLDDRERVGRPPDQAVLLIGQVEDQGERWPGPSHAEGLGTDRHLCSPGVTSARQRSRPGSAFPVAERHRRRR